jgi:hypothetical protein
MFTRRNTDVSHPIRTNTPRLSFGNKKFGTQQLRFPHSLLKPTHCFSSHVSALSPPPFSYIQRENASQFLPTFVCGRPNNALHGLLVLHTCTPPFTVNPGSARQCSTQCNIPYYTVLLPWHITRAYSVLVFVQIGTVTGNVLGRTVLPYVGNTEHENLEIAWCMHVYQPADLVLNSFVQKIHCVYLHVRSFQWTCLLRHFPYSFFDLRPLKY